MSQYHIVHIIPDQRLHILNGYNDVIKTIIWGLRCHGHEVTYAVNMPRLDARNIVFGANMALRQVLDLLPSDTVIYNLEQVAGMVLGEAMKGRLLDLSNRFEIWDYSELNILGWQTLNEHCVVKHVPIGFAPIISTIEKPPEQDIDALIYGGPGDNRIRIFTDLCMQGATTLYCFGLYDKARDDLIARSKLVLNISHSISNVFSIVRTSYLLANRKAVIADTKPAMVIESDLIGALKFTDLDSFVDVCIHYINDDAAREKLEEDGFEIFKKRDIRAILAPALNG